MSDSLFNLAEFVLLAIQKGNVDAATVLSLSIIILFFSTLEAKEASAFTTSRVVPCSSPTTYHVYLDCIGKQAGEIAYSSWKQKALFTNSIEALK